MERSSRYQLFLVAPRRPPVFTMQFKRVMLSLFVSAFACTIVLMIYVQYLAIPGQIIKPLRTVDDNISNSSVIAEQANANENSFISNPIAVHQKAESKANMNLIPIMAFEDLGVNKKKVMLLIIVTTAPPRFDRRQAIRDTWWKHCTRDKVST